MSAFGGVSLVTANLTLSLDATNIKSWANTGTIWSDLSLGKNNTTLTVAPIYNANGTFTFNGSTQYATIPNAAVQAGNQISICMWVNIGAIISSSFFAAVDGSSNRIAQMHLPWSDSQVYWDCGSGGGGYDRVNTSALTTAQKTGWHYWTFTKNATTGYQAIYLDTVLLASGTSKTQAIATPSTIYLGGGWSGYFWSGTTGNIQIYNAELTGSQIQQNFNAMRGRYGL